MELQKAHWLNDSDNVHLIMPFAKVDQENRTVSGFASLNNIDKTDDVVTADASSEAFASFRGNIREMHDSKLAAGRMVSFSQQPYYDAQTGQTFQGIYVTVYVSKGAPNTWEKVLDGTLSGFSIGGHIIDQHVEYMAELNKTVRFITKLDLFELSLVDNPANQYANVLSINKVDGELIIKGMVAESVTQNVFWCETDQAARVSEEDSATCVQCSVDMQSIGWIEVDPTSTAESELKKFMDDWTNKVITTSDFKESGGEKPAQQNHEFATEDNFGDNKNNTESKSEGGVNMSENETVEKAAEIDEVVEETTEKAEVVEETPEETVEKTEDVVETVEDDAVLKAMEEIKTFVSDAVTKSATEQTTFAETMTSAIDEIKKSLEALSTLSEAVEKANTAVLEVAGKVENLERATAIKKSGDDDTSEPVKKGFSWGGHFASASTITN